jgi:hypothetical protein
VVLEGTGRIRVDEDLLSLEPLSALSVEPEHVRQVFNDTDADALWLVVGAPPEVANTLEMTDQQLAALYPDDPKALPPELGGWHLRGLDGRSVEPADSDHPCARRSRVLVTSCASAVPVSAPTIASAG